MTSADLAANAPTDIEPEATQAAVEGRTPLQLAWRRLRRDKVAMVALTFIVLLILVAIFAPVLTGIIGHGPEQQLYTTGLSPAGVPVGPSSHFLLGADQLGRDVLSRLIYGSRISLAIGVGATLIALALGLMVGVVAGFYGGVVDTVLARIMDVLLSFPVLLFAIALVARLGPSVQLTLLVIAFFSFPAIGRLVRGQVISLREREFVEAARSLGASNARIMAFDIVPNLIALAVVYATLLIPANIVAEATLSYLGLGVLPPTPSWGNMIADAQAGNLYTIAWWFILFPSLALFLTTLAFNLLGDGLRDALDPRSGRSQLG